VIGFRAETAERAKSVFFIAALRQAMSSMGAG